MNTVKIKEKYYMKCTSNCNRNFQASVCNMYLVARVIVMSNEESKVLSIFQPEFAKMLLLKGLSFEPTLNKKMLEEQVLSIIPAQFAVDIKNGTVRSIHAPKE